jgi:hypothetical protein
MRVLKVVLEGHLDVALLDDKFAPIAAQLARDKLGGYGLVVDIVKMTGYDSAARAKYIQWHQKHRSRLVVAVVTTNPLWRMVIAAVALAATGRMRAFDSMPAAVGWLEGLSGPLAADG